MKKINLILLLVLAGNLACYCANYNVDEVSAEFKKCYIEQTSKCFFRLSRKYDIPLIRYYYALALVNEKQISKAKIVLEEIIQSQSSTSTVSKLAQNELKQLEELSKNMQTAERMIRAIITTSLKIKPSGKNLHQLRFI